MKVPPALVQRYPKVFFSGADLNSHLELETKWKVELNDVAAYKAKLDQLVGDPKLTEQVLGKGWKVTANTRFVGKPMVDNYDDDPRRSPPASHGVFATAASRATATTTSTSSPTAAGGQTVFDPVIRAEYDLAVNKRCATTRACSPLIGSGEHLDVLRFGPKFDPAEARGRFELSDIRAKYDFEHMSGPRSFEPRSTT